MKSSQSGKLFVSHSTMGVKPHFNYLKNFSGMVHTIEPKTDIAKKVLVIEDEGEIGLLLDIALSDRNIDLDYVNNLTAAEHYLKDSVPSVIILDNKLPDGFGIDFIRYIKKHSPTTKIVMISGFGAAYDVALSNGADLFIEKPFTAATINEAIDKVCA